MTLHENTILLSGGRLSYYDTGGSALPILFIHGNSSHKDSFLPLIHARLKSDVRLIALDLPGHGKSDPWAHYSIPRFASLVDEFLCREGIAQLDVLGHSLGGHIAHHLVATGKLRRVFSMGAPPLGLGLDPAQVFINPTALGFYSKNKLTDAEITTLYKETHYQQDAERAKDFKLGILQTDPNFRESLMASISRGELEDERKILKTSNALITLILGEKETLINKQYLKEAGDELGDHVSFCEVKQAGHFAHLDNPRDLANLISSPK